MFPHLYFEIVWLFDYLLQNRVEGKTEQQNNTNVKLLHWTYIIELLYYSILIYWTYINSNNIRVMSTQKLLNLPIVVWKTNIKPNSAATAVDSGVYT